VKGSARDGERATEGVREVDGGRDRKGERREDTMEQRSIVESSEK
jgi:hypothetical protein